MKAYLDSVSQHKIDETVSELNSSFISMDRQRKESSFGKAKGGLEEVNEADDESKASIVDKNNDLADLYKKT